MKNIKTIFIFSLINFAIVLAGVSLVKIGTETAITNRETPVIIPVTDSPARNTNVTSTPTVSNRCIVTVDSVRYDLTDFVNLHSGGDIFVCNTDMSNSFHNRHQNSYLKVMAKYKI